MERHCANARAVVELLLGHPAVERVLYPQLPDHPGHAAAAKRGADARSVSERCSAHAWAGSQAGAPQGRRGEKEICCEKQSCRKEEVREKKQSAGETEKGGQEEVS